MSPAVRRPLYRRAQLDRLLNPRSIAIVGASARPGSFGERTQRNLAGFAGRLHLVNARYDRLGDLPCHPSVAAVVYAAGFAETGRPERIALQNRIAGVAREGGVRLVGPNCIGLLDYASGATVSFAAVPRPARPPGAAALGIVSQSGNLGFAMAQGVERGVSVARVLACGNSADVDVADCVSALAEDPAC